mmetsp:Transcript_1275/g.1571  ORF Transcript_1275/g.1571 Transcript_1275/m.1571 type:complete len:91 (-) Transcript_1275:844-1116(-)
MQNSSDRICSQKTSNGAKHRACCHARIALFLLVSVLQISIQPVQCPSEAERTQARRVVALPGKLSLRTLESSQRLMVCGDESTRSQRSQR